MCNNWIYLPMYLQSIYLRNIKDTVCWIVYYVELRNDNIKNWNIYHTFYIIFCYHLFLISCSRYDSWNSYNFVLINIGNSTFNSYRLLFYSIFRVSFCKISSLWKKNIFHKILWRVVRSLRRCTFCKFYTNNKEKTAVKNTNARIKRNRHACMVHICKEENRRKIHLWNACRRRINFQLLRSIL